MRHSLLFKAMIVFLLLHSHLPHTVRVALSLEAQTRQIYLCSFAEKERRKVDGKKCVASENMSMSAYTILFKCIKSNPILSATTHALMQCLKMRHSLSLERVVQK